MKNKDLSPQMIELKKCAGRAMNQLSKIKKKELTEYYLQECAKSGVFPVKAVKGIKPAIPEGEPTGKERYKITMRSRSLAQTRIRKQFYDLYLEIYDVELSKSGLARNKERWGSLKTIENLEAEVKRLQRLVSDCTCRSFHMVDLTYKSIS
jgi:hypothetical protein